MTVVPGQSQENLPNPTAAHIYSVEKGLMELPFLPIPANRRCCWASIHPTGMEETFHFNGDETAHIVHMRLIFSDFFIYLFKGLL